MASMQNPFGSQSLPKSMPSRNRASQATSKSPQSPPLFSEVDALCLIEQRAQALSKIEEVLARLDELVLGERYDTYTQNDSKCFQDEANSVIADIARLCAELPRLPSSASRSIPVILVKNKAVEILSRQIDLKYLGLDMGINLVARYRHIAEPNRSALVVAAESAGSQEDRESALQDLSSFDRAIVTFQKSMEKYMKARIHEGCTPPPPDFQSADELADVLNRASNLTVDSLTAEDVYLLCGGKSLFSSFVAQMSNVATTEMNLAIVRRALGLTQKESADNGNLKNRIEFAMRSNEIQLEDLTGVEDRLQQSSLGSSLTSSKNSSLDSSSTNDPPSKGDIWLLR